MTYTWKHNRGGTYVAVKGTDGKIHHVYVGMVSDTVAKKLAAFIDDLATSAANGIKPSPSTIEWTQNIDEAFRKKLVKACLLIEPKRVAWTISTWIQKVIDDSQGAQASKRKLSNVKNHLVGFLGDMLLTEVTTGDCRRFIEHVNANYAPTHAYKLAHTAKQLFGYAIQDQVVSANPFTGLKFSHKKPRKESQSYVDRERFQRVLDKSRHTQAELLFSLARFGGLRIPHEALAVEWSHVDWDKMQLTVPCDTKTGYRVLPIFPEFADLLEAAQNASNSKYIIHQARASAGSTWRNWLLEAIRKAGQKEWPKLWMNLRASCRTDLEDRFPSHVCDSWLGHSHKVAREHYLQVTPEHWKEAIGKAVVKECLIREE